MKPSPVEVGDVIVVPEGNGAWSGKVGRVRLLAITWCEVAIPIASAGPNTTVHHLVRVNMADLEPSRR